MNLNEIANKTTIFDQYKKSAIRHETTEDKEIFIFLDEEPMNPRTEQDNLGTIIYSNKSGYILGDKAVDPTHFGLKFREKAVWLPVYAYIHGGISLSTKPFHCPWDSAQSGYIYADYDKIRTWYGWKKLTKKRIDHVQTWLECEIEQFNQWLSGQVYGFKTFNKATGDEIDSCWGIYDSPEAIVKGIAAGAF